jgi:hypothetical protein
MNLGCEKQLVAYLLCKALPICSSGFGLHLLNVLNDFPHTANNGEFIDKG